MLDSIHIAEIFAQAKRDDFERAAERQKLLAEARASKASRHPRQTIAGALVRLAMVIDKSAGRRISAPAAQ